MGAPGTTVIMEILETIFSAEEAALAAQIPLGLSSLDRIAGIVDLP